MLLGYTLLWFVARVHVVMVARVHMVMVARIHMVMVLGCTSWLLG